MLVMVMVMTTKVVVIATAVVVATERGGEDVLLSMIKVPSKYGDADEERR